MNTTHTVVIIVLGILFGPPARANDPERLLPSAEAAKINMAWRQDGRAQIVTITNNSKLVLTAAEISCALFDTAKPFPNISPTGLKWCTSDISNGQDYRLQYEGAYMTVGKGGERCQLFAINWDLTESVFPVLPGKSKEFYFEREAGRILPVSCGLHNPRGRAKKFLDF